MNGNYPAEHDLDRLVDGELSSQEYRKLLARFDADPRLWKQCALAFLEDQALRKELPVAIEPAENAIPLKTKTPAATMIPLWLAVAATFIIALYVGSTLPRAWKHWIATPEVSGELAEIRSQANELLDPSPVPPPKTEQVDEQRNRPPLSLAAEATLYIGGESEQQFSLPVYDVTDSPQDWRFPEEAAAVTSVVDALEQAGRRVQRQTELVPVGWQNGKQLYIPVEQFHISPSETVFYQ